MAGHLGPPLQGHPAYSDATAVGGNRPRPLNPIPPGCGYRLAGPGEVGFGGARFPWITPAAVPPPYAVMFTSRPAPTEWSAADTTPAGS